MDVSVAEAAARLGVDRSRVQRLLRDGVLPGRRLGREWLVDGQAVAHLAEHPRGAGRPMAPARAWGVLDLLDGGSAPWLSPVARSQVRQQIRALVAADAQRWSDALRGRSEVLRVRLHPAGIDRLLKQPARSRVLVAGVSQAVAQGADLVALGGISEVYVRPADWPGLSKALHAVEDRDSSNLVVRLPLGPWPFHDDVEVGASALAADLLESTEPRAIAAGANLLRELAAGR